MLRWFTRSPDRLVMLRLNLRVWWTSPRTTYWLRTARACAIAAAAVLVLVPLTWEVSGA